MIQRIQSIYLILAAGIQALFALGTYYTFNDKQLTGEGLFNAEGLQIGGDSKTMAMSFIIGGLSIISMVVFKNRKLQMKLANGAGLLGFAQIVFLVRSYMNLTLIDQADLSIGFVVFLMPFSMILNFLAAKSIKKDDNLVRSVDRIR
jgi:hypothetical protein|tara:strand:- start:874 stop:1314 length:441 start_codon:yes stop_codon:yes gene_type:complete